MDLSSMFQNLGPAGGAMLTGMQMADATNEQKSQEAYRKAQMEDIMQRTSQQAEMHPLELQSKKQLIEKGTQDLEKGKVDLEKSKYDLTVGKLEGAVKKVDAYTQLLNAAALQLQNIPVKAPGDPTRHNFLAKFATDNGIDLKDPAIQGLIQQTSAIPADKLPEAILGFSNKLALSKPNIVGKLAEIKQQGIEQRSLEGMRETSRQKLAEEKLNKLKSYEAQISAAKGDKNKASVARQWAMTATDEKDRAEYERQATIYDAAALEQNPATIKNKGEQEAFDRLSGKARPLGPTPKKDLSIQDMRNQL
jgi:hypothetical protein